MDEMGGIIDAAIKVYRIYEEIILKTVWKIEIGCGGLLWQLN